MKHRLFREDPDTYRCADCGEPDPIDQDNGCPGPKNLSAAAPDLYAALEALVRFCDGPAGGNAPILESARAALAKARGES